MKIKILLFTVMLLALPINIAFAQDIGDDTESNLLFGGIRYDDGLHLTAGYGKPVAGQLWTLLYANLGFNYGSWNTEFVYFFKPSDNFYIGPMAGADADWVNAGEGEQIITYFVGATGVVAAYNITENVGCWGYIKYNDSFETDNNYVGGTSTGIGFHLWF